MLAEMLEEMVSVIEADSQRKVFVLQENYEASALTERQPVV